MEKNQVRVTYFFKSENRHDALDSAEIIVTRGWRGDGYETLESVANRCTPTSGGEWITVHRNDRQAVTFRAANLESIEYEANE